MTLMVTFTLLACEEKTYELTWTEKQAADSIYRERAKIISARMDSLCELRQDSLVQHYYDSLLNIRITELTEE